MRATRQEAPTARREPAGAAPAGAALASGLRMAAWLDLAEDKGYLLKMSDLLDMKIPSTLRVVVSLEQERKEDAKQGCVYTPLEYFASNIETVKRLGATSYTLDGLAHETKTGHPFVDRGDGLASLGSGDDTSMTVENAMRMPNILYEEEEGDDDNDDDDDEESNDDED